ncbi:Planctomycete cytochrome C [Polystyrenella longa]|uniref:Planctomycete cytochrome C n=1 Tax=Polystyrenella longa TaxID=2528007 RepID=A0A518CJL4_9PLAN|nr:PSD1 and planctomycete cytochrome C domain-containing protein [Polystyrenella longa]QDU79410.1 Planctomycete cytochrome C [Polystyrenella longa]
MTRPLSSIPFLALVLFCLTNGVIFAEEPTAAERSSEVTEIDHERDIAPLFATHCLDCHGPDLQESEFRIDRRAWLLRGGNSGEPALIPGKPDESHLLQLVKSTNEEEQMPPGGPALSDQEIGLLSAWIKAGAVVPGSEADEEIKLTTDHWSFQPIAEVKPPAGITNWGATGIDQFIGARLMEKGLEPSAPAERRELIRRLYLVMLGLPPTPAEVTSFEQDERPDAYARLVERVLESPQYGERWAQHWLDLVRFGETTGFETNRERPHAWRYRDYVIACFNDDKPYDQFIREQLAGDVLDADLGTGYLVAGPHDLVKSPDINLTLMQRQDELADLINTTGTAFLGLTLGCARCHNHKFDPITQSDYYSIQAVFAGVEHGDRTLRYPEDSPESQRMKIVQQELKKIDRELADSGLRQPVNSKQNVEEFETVLASSLRFSIEATIGGNEPCLDEIEIFAADSKEAAGKPLDSETNDLTFNTSGTLPGYAIHQLQHVCDGRVGNQHSWVSSERGKGWVQIDLEQPQYLSKVVWGRDRLGQYRDRVPSQYKIEVQIPGTEQWQLVATSLTRLPGEGSTTDISNVQTESQSQNLADLQAMVIERQTLKSEFDKLKSNQPQGYLGRFTEPGPTHRLYRGDPMAKREEVVPDTIEVLGTLGLEKETNESERRVKLADWIVSSDNPLTSRVIVNRLWQFHFGTGIVDTPSDFGGNGTLPTHPELLDWLANELRSNNWSLKHIHRLILTSQTFQQSSHPVAKGLEVDAAARYLWRFPPRRLAAEVIRDQILAVSDVLNLEQGGPGFSAFAVDFENVRHYHPKQNYGPEDWRRMIYMTKVRQEKDSVFGLFDCPDASQVVAKRSRSTTPLQALNLYNSRFVLQQADLFSQRLRREAPDSVDNQIQLAFKLAYNRPIEAIELSRSKQFVEEQGLVAMCRAIFNSNEFLFIP